MTPSCISPPRLSQSSPPRLSQSRLSRSSSPRLTLLLALAAVLVSAPACAAGPPGKAATGPSQPAELRELTLPPGFSIALYARVPGARSMTLGARGTLFVGTRGDSVYAVRDGQVLKIAQGLDTPNGVAFRDGSLYVAEISRILRYDAIEERLAKPPEPVVVTAAFPRDRHHGWKFIRFGPDGRLYVPVGAPCNVCERQDPYAAITRVSPDGRTIEVVARGVRNTVGFDWHPQTKELWFTDNGRDMMGDDVPPCELNHAPKAGLHFGFPYCHGRAVQDPEYSGRACPSFTPPAVEFPAHVAPLGMRFYTGSMFPAEWRGRIFVAQHGSWNRSVPDGYRVVAVDIGPGGPKVIPFIEGFLRGRSSWGRPVDVEPLPDGSLLVSDDKAGAIYRVSFK